MIESSNFPVSVVDQIEQGDRAQRIGVLFKTPDIDSVYLKSYLRNIMKMENTTDARELDYLLSIALVRNEKNQSLVEFYKADNKLAHQILIDNLSHELINQRFIVNKKFKLCDNIIMNYLFLRWRVLSFDEFYDLISLVHNIDCLTKMKNSENKSLESLLITGRLLEYVRVLKDFLSADTMLDLPPCVSSQDQFIIAELFFDYKDKNIDWLKNKLQELDNIESIDLVRNRHGLNLVTFYKKKRKAFLKQLTEFKHNKLAVGSSKKEFSHKVFFSFSKLMINKQHAKNQNKSKASKNEKPYNSKLFINNNHCKNKQREQSTNPDGRVDNHSCKFRVGLH